jgi:quinol monooxygenase YgiN
VPIDDKTGTELYMIEEYASQKVSNDHLSTAPVQDLIKLFTTGDVLAGAPEVHNTHTVAEKIAKPPPTLSSGPAILLASIEYKPGTLAHALEGWKELVSYVEKNEEGTRAYAITAAEGGSEVRAVEVYDSWDYVFKVHAKSPAMAECTRHNGKDRVGRIGIVQLRAVDGFLGRERGRAKI